MQQIASTSELVTTQQRDALADFAARARAGDDSLDTIQDTRTVLMVLKELTANFQRSISTASDEERKALNQYDGLIGMKRSALTQLTSSKDAKDALLAEDLQRVAQLKRSLVDAKTLQNSGAEYMRALRKVCTDLSNQWAGRAQVRQDIVAGLQQTMNMLQQGSPAAEPVPAALLAAGAAAPSFVQVGVSSTSSSALKRPASGAELSRVEEIAGAGSADDFSLDMAIPADLAMSGPPVTDGRVAPSMSLSPSPAGALLSAQQDFSQLQSLGASGIAPAAAQNIGVDVAAAASALPPRGNGPAMMAAPPPRGASGASSSAAPASTSSLLRVQDVLGAQQQVNDAEEVQQKQNTYTAVKQMVEQMIGQMKQAREQEEQHKSWCDAEIARNSRSGAEKRARLKRLQTKVDSEREVVAEVGQDLATLEGEEASCKREMTGFAQLRSAGHGFFGKAAQNAQIAQQILGQAELIVQRYAALAEESSLAALPPAGGFLMVGSSAATAGGSRAAGAADAGRLANMARTAVESLGTLTTRYAQLREVVAKADNEAGLSSELLSREGGAMMKALTQAKSYSLRYFSASRMMRADVTASTGCPLLRAFDAELRQFGLSLQYLFWDSVRPKYPTQVPWESEAAEYLPTRRRRRGRELSEAADGFCSVVPESPAHGVRGHLGALRRASAAARGQLAGAGAGAQRDQHRQRGCHPRTAEQPRAERGSSGRRPLAASLVLASERPLVVYHESASDDPWKRFLSRRGAAPGVVGAARRSGQLGGGGAVRTRGFRRGAAASLVVDGNRHCADGRGDGPGQYRRRLCAARRPEFARPDLPGDRFPDGAYVQCWSTGHGFTRAIVRAAQSPVQYPRGFAKSARLELPAGRSRDSERVWVEHAPGVDWLTCEDRAQGLVCLSAKVVAFARAPIKFDIRIG